MTAVAEHQVLHLREFSCRRCNALLDTQAFVDGGIRDQGEWQTEFQTGLQERAISGSANVNNLVVNSRHVSLLFMGKG
ncbi:hypothetical protein D3C73_1541940 [compost metagenome]